MSALRKLPGILCKNDGRAAGVAGFMADRAAWPGRLPRVTGLHVFDKGHIVSGVLLYAGQVFRAFFFSPFRAVKGEK